MIKKIIWVTVLGVFVCCADTSAPVEFESQAAITPEPTTFRVMSYNIRTSTSYMDEHSEAWLAGLIDNITKYGPDVLLLQEVEETIAGIPYVPNALVWALEDRGLNYNHEYVRRFEQGTSGFFGQMVLSKTEINNFEAIWHFYDSSNTNYQDRMQRFVTIIDGYPISFYNYHPQPSQACAAANILHDTIEDGGHLMDSIIVGDFNRQAHDVCLDNMMAHFENACLVKALDTAESCHWTIDRLVWAGGQHAPPNLGRAIDHILYAKDFSQGGKTVTLKSIEADHATNSGVNISDHFPVIATFEISRDSIQGPDANHRQNAY